MENLQKQIESLRRWRWLVIAFGVLGMIAALAIASSGSTTYTATSVVVVGSASTQSTSSRSPDQDAVLAAGYVSILNSDSHQRTLKSIGKVPDNVDISASPVAGSPFINIAATASTPEVAVQASNRLRDRVRRGHAEAVHRHRRRNARPAAHAPQGGRDADRGRTSRRSRRRRRPPRSPASRASSTSSTRRRPASPRPSACRRQWPATPTSRASTPSPTAPPRRRRASSPTASSA